MFSSGPMSYEEFLDTVRVLKLLYGSQVAEKFFTKNVDLYYDLSSESLHNLLEKEK